MATTITAVSAMAGAITGAAPAPVALNATSFGSAPAVALTTGTAVQYNFVNNGSFLVAIYNSAAAGGTTWEPTLYPTTSGAPSIAVLGVTLPLTSMIVTTPSTIGTFVFGPFPPSKFNDANGLCWITQVAASAVTSFLGLFSLPGAAS